jgi:hypothetical protein
MLGSLNLSQHLKLIPALLIVLSYSFARADILFVDMDDAPEEIAAAKQAATQRHERLLVIPHRSTPEEIDALYEVNKFEFEKTQVMEPATGLWKKFDVIHAQLLSEQAKTHPNQKIENQLRILEGAALATYNKKFNELIVKKADPLTAEEKKIPNLPTFKIEDLRALLADEENQKKTISAIILSGHHGDGEFHGVLGNINRADLLKEFAVYPTLLKGVHSIFGWGCYTVTIDNEDWWTTNWPQVNLLAGFEGGAPSSVNIESHILLQELLVRDAELRARSLALKTPKQLRGLGHDIESLYEFSDMNTAVTTRQVYTGHSSGIISLTDIASTCNDQALQTLKAPFAHFQAVLDGKEAQPCETQHTWLRSYYDQLRAYVHCPKIQSPMKVKFAPFKGMADKAVKALFWPQVTANAFSYYQKDLVPALDFLDETGVGTPNLNLPRACEPTLPNSGSITSKEISDLQAAICAIIPSHPEFKKACTALTMVQSLSPCIPFSWVEPPLPDGSVEPPLCEN